MEKIKHDVTVHGYNYINPHTHTGKIWLIQRHGYQALGDTSNWNKGQVGHVRERSPPVGVFFLTMQFMRFLLIHL